MPSKPTLTEKNLPDQSGKVFIVTGANAGVGKELTQILYSKNAKVYLAARSAEKVAAAITTIKAAFPDSKGELVYLHLDLNDLTTIKASAEEFLAKESKLDVLWNNAGVMIPPQGSETKQGYELQLGTNCVAPFLFTKLLTPLLVKTAKEAPKASVRVVWVSSSAALVLSPNGGVDMGNIDYKSGKMAQQKYGVSKAGNYLHGAEFARRFGGEGIVSVTVHPGVLKTDLMRYAGGLYSFVLGFFQHEPIYGAYSELFAGLSPEVTLEQNGCWIMPWGKITPIRKDLHAATKSTAEGGTGNGAKFWDWTEEQVKPYV